MFTGNPTYPFLFRVNFFSILVQYRVEGDYRLTVQLSRFQRDSPDNEAHVPSPASPKVGTIDVPTSALYLQFTFSALRTLS